MKNKTIKTGLTALLIFGVVGGPLTTVAPAYAAGLPSITQVKENNQTGQRTSATTLSISLGANINGIIDVGTGNLLATMNLSGVTLSHNSLTPQTTGTGVSAD